MGKVVFELYDLVDLIEYCKMLRNASSKAYQHTIKPLAYELSWHVIGMAEKVENKAFEVITKCANERVLHTEENPFSFDECLTIAKWIYPRCKENAIAVYCFRNSPYFNTSSSFGERVLETIDVSAEVEED